MSTAIAPPLRAKLVLADAVPGHRIRDAVLIVCGALLTAAAAQIAVHVPPSPVPITGQTLAVIVAGASLGARRGAASQALYLLLGFVLPVYADGAHGVSVLWGATGGYLVGFVAAAGAVGWLAERGADRRMPAAVATFALGQLLIFGIGVPWLQVSTGMSWERAIHDGFAIFIVGGIVKAAVAGVLTPAAWRLVRRVDGD
ncbi:MAG: biotin transport system substrate-specific component [Solirubrobacteraceae bacterium]|nr:biotin transport system substrate-specific component [Solirubrobacteraceae bacterium]